MLDRYGLHMRAALFKAIRDFFSQSGFLEVDTPLLQPVVIPEANIVPIRAGTWFLQSSPELAMKRLLASIEDDIFQLCPCFRKHESGRLHNEEFWMLEWYRRDGSYLDLMEDCQKLLLYIKERLQTTSKRLGRTEPVFDGLDIDSPNWPRTSVLQGFQRYAQISLEEAICQNRFDEVLVEEIEPHLGHKIPEFFLDYPLAYGSLAKASVDDPSIVERFELYLSGIELANGFTELVDPVEQRRRFLEEIETLFVQRGEKAQMPERFLESLGRLGPTAGIALGVDRLFMLALGRSSLAESMTFGPDDYD